MRLGERYGEIEYRGGRVIQRWRGSNGNVRLSHLLINEFLVIKALPNSDRCGGMNERSDFQNSLRPFDQVVNGVVVPPSLDVLPRRFARSLQRPAAVPWSITKIVTDVSVVYTAHSDARAACPLPRYWPPARAWRQLLGQAAPLVLSRWTVWLCEYSTHN